MADVMDLKYGSSETSQDEKLSRVGEDRPSVLYSGNVGTWLNEVNRCIPACI